MPDLALDLRNLEDAVLAAEPGRFRRVADAADLSRSTVSRRILHRRNPSRRCLLRRMCEDHARDFEGTKYRLGIAPDRRILQAIYRAFVDAQAWERWLPPEGMTGRIDRFEPRPGGRGS